MSQTWSMFLICSSVISVYGSFAVVHGFGIAAKSLPYDGEAM